MRILGTDFDPDFGADFGPDFGPYFFLNEITLKFTRVTFFECSKLYSFLDTVYIKICIKIRSPRNLEITCYSIRCCIQWHDVLIVRTFTNEMYQVWSAGAGYHAGRDTSDCVLIRPCCMEERNERRNFRPSSEL